MYQDVLGIFVTIILFITCERIGCTIAAPALKC